MSSSGAPGIANRVGPVDLSDTRSTLNGEAPPGGPDSERDGRARVLEKVEGMLNLRADHLAGADPADPVPSRDFR